MSSVLKTIGNFFSFEVLDKRLVPEPSSQQQLKTIKKAHESRWKTPEFFIYYLVFIVVVPMMFKTALSLSNETNQNYWIYQKILSDGWLFGRKVDNSDAQYRFFRNNFPLLVLLMSLHLVIKKLTLRRLRIPLLKFDFVFGLVFLFAIHGFNSIRIAFHVMTVYLITKYVKNIKLAMFLTWIYSISTLFINDRWYLVRFSSFSSWLSFLDSFHGIVQRWDVFYNFTLLRMISYNLDYLQKKKEALDAVEVKPKDDQDQAQDVPLEEISGDSGSELYNKAEKNISGAPTAKYPSERERLNAPLPLEDYNIANYIAYLTYAPLFIAGPIITFNDFVYQSRHKSPFITLKSVSIYAARFVFCIMTMEFILHYIYVVAVSKLKLWHNDTLFQISMIGLFNLNIIWLKLLIPWRFFRLWSLLDDIDPPENMLRCMNNNNSLISFWRAWHRSFSRWLIRYVYVPLGGSNNRFLTSLCAFSFVAIWHDIQLKLLFWGWLVVIFLLPEIILSKYFTRFEDRWWYRHVCCVGSVVNIWMMMVANLFGFCLGMDGTKDFLTKLFHSFEGFRFFIIASGCLFVAVQVQNELREHEKRRGIDVRC